MKLSEKRNTENPYVTFNVLVMETWITKLSCAYSTLPDGMEM
ncbi:hypothetical protein OTUT144_0213 [Orientia tsutsugamushi str. UT144]|uniref:Uncharacterized protein n=1 Tax=Orientia tsutsugamushi str. UT144 TaxID=1441384 RepID=A0A0F3RP60_ORITS|nr:hypothetical protein OTUT144_0213 [Orientia tsutsugamushi str. UT144]